MVTNENLDEQLLRQISESISKREGRTIELKDIMEYEQYRKPSNLLSELNDIPISIGSYHLD